VSHHPLADYVRILARGKNASRSMSFDEARFTMQSMLRGDYLPEQLGAILMLLRVKEESPEEVAGFAAAINEYWPADVQADLIWASYAGKRRQPFWCLLSALLLSQMGYRILFHGSEAHTEGRLYLHELFSELQWPVVRDLNELQQSAPLRYLPCRVLHPELQRWLLLKSILGVRSPINTVLKTIAPPGIASVQGVFHPNYAAAHQQAAAINGQTAVIIKGEGGEFEVNPERRCEAYCQLPQGPAQLELLHQQSHYEDKGGLDGLAALQRVWRNEEQHAYATEAIIGTAALALCAIRGNADLSLALADCRQAWEQRDTRCF